MNVNHYGRNFQILSKYYETFFIHNEQNTIYYAINFLIKISKK